MGEPRLGAVIVSYDSRELTLAAVASVLESRGVRPEVWVVDNASADGSAAAVRARHPEVRIIELHENVGFGRGNNVALERIDTEHVLLLNSDASFADPDGLRRLVDALDGAPRVGVVGPRLEGPDGRLEYSARAFPAILGELARGTGLHVLLPRLVRERRLGLEFRDHTRPGPADWLTGACLLVRGDVVRQVGGFDPAIFLYGEELDWCWRVREAGWEIVLEPSVTVLHRRGASGDFPAAWKLRMSMAGDAYVLRKHRGRVYLAVFALARVVGLCAEALVQGAAGALGGAPSRWARARHARAALGAWISALLRGGARDPAGPRIRTAPASEGVEG